MNKSISYIFLFALSLLLSCSDEQEGAPNAKPEVQGKTIALTFISQPLQESGVVTRSTGKGMDLLMGEESDVSTRATPAEEQIANVCIFQFEGSKESSNAVLRAMFYQENLTDNRQYIKLAAASNPCFLYVCANVGDLTSNYTVDSSTFQEIMNTSFIFSEQEENSLLPMSGCSDINDTGSASILLTRIFAKVTFTCDLSHLPTGDAFEITGATLRNVPKSVAYYPSAGDAVTPTINVISLTGTPLVSSDSKTTYSWYMPENLRGPGTADKWTERIERNAPNYATYIELIGSYTSSGSAEASEVTYVIYLGDGYNVNNYDVQRNHSYQIIANIKGKNTTSDLRVTDYINLSADGLANCYLASENNHKYCFNGTVRGNGNTEDYAHQQYGGDLYENDRHPGISMMPSKIGNAADAVTIPIENVAKAGVVWETKAGIITDVSWDSATGRVKFETGSVLGNALLAVYDKNNNILWSWHIWRTDGVDLVELNRNHVVKFETNTTYSWYTALYPGYGRKRDLVMMECNIGAHLDKNGSAKIYQGNTNEYNIGYQFGRKDPIPMVSVANGTIGTVGAASTATGVTDILDYIILNPNKFIMGLPNTGYNWMNGATLNSEVWCVSNCLWGDNNPYGGNGANAIGNLDPVPWGVSSPDPKEANCSKTIYDPSPAGWRVAPADTWSAVTNGSVANWANVNAYVGGFSYGYTFRFGNDPSIIAFSPALGYRDSGNGNVTLVGQNGYGWLSSPCGQSEMGAKSLAFKSVAVHVAGDNPRALGAAVRCVHE